MSERRFGSGRHAGALVPLFSIPSRSSWGVGEIPDLPRFANWLAAAGLDFVQLLPVNEMEDGQHSPYSALSAMAIDPVFIAVEEIAGFAASGGTAAFSAEDRAALDTARLAPRVRYGTIRALKSRALRGAFERFERDDWRVGSDRAGALVEFMARERWWLDDYALFRALHHEYGGRYWREWADGLRDREPGALEAARRRLAPEMLYRSWVQWIADDQWRRARRDGPSIGAFGDFPFAVSAHSADVWARQHEFRLDASVGVPPDAFSETGQDWGLPVYRWDVMAAGGYGWLRDRVRRCVDLYDGFRVDHLVGFYRTFVRERDGRTAFVPPDERLQIAQGEFLVRLFCEGGATVIAEDLGSVPDFVRESLARTHVPGLKVLRWERDWHAAGRPFRDPSTYPAASVALSGTHDTETMADWWNGAPPDERARLVEMLSFYGAGCEASEAFCERTRDALLEALFGARSAFVLLPVQDIFGWRDRVNTPASVDDLNWTWRLPWPVEDLMSEPVPRERARFLRELGVRHGRSPSP